MHQIFYITLDPEKSLGVEDLITSYHILYSEASQMAIPISDNGIDIKNFPKKYDTKINSTSQMLKDEKLLDYIKERAHETPNILVFKNDAQIEALAKENNLHLINPSAKLNTRFENKLEFTNFLEQKKINQPEYFIFEKLSDLNYNEISQRFGNEFVVQFIFGHSGSSTFFISSEESLQKIQNDFPLRKGKVSRKIIGPTYTVNACITKLGIVIGGISEQITGISELTSSLGGTVGNDFSQRHLSENLRSLIIEQTTEFGEILKKEGHRGIFGLDFVIEEGTNKIYFIEANIRQVASATYTSYLQRLNKVVPIMLWHILELLNFDYDKKLDLLSETDEEWINEGITEFRLSNDKHGLNVKNNLPIKASQILFRNIQNHNVQILDQFPSGIYRIRGRNPDDASLLENDKSYMSVYRLREDGWSTLCLESRGYNIMQAKKLDGFLITTKPEKSFIEPLGEIGRIQVLESAFGSVEDKYPSGWIMDVVKCVYENVRIIKNTGE